MFLLTKGKAIIGTLLMKGSLTVGGHSAFGPDAEVDGLLPFDFYNGQAPGVGATTPSLLFAQSDLAMGATDESVQGVAGILNITANAIAYGSAAGLYGFGGVGDIALAGTLLLYGMQAVAFFDGQDASNQSASIGGVFLGRTGVNADGVVGITGVEGQAYLGGGTIEGGTAAPNITAFNASQVVIDTGATAHKAASFYAAGVYNSGTLDDFYGLYVHDLVLSGGGTLNNTAWGVYVAGNNPSFFGGPLILPEISDPAAPASNSGALYVRDNGGGKSQIVARFPSGAVQVIATEPA